MYDHFDKGNLVYEVFKIDMKLGSFYPNIAIFISRNVLTLEFSVPKQIFGNNIQQAKFSDIIPILDTIKSHLQIEMGVEFKEEIDNWNIQRLDICDYIHSSDIDTFLKRLQETSYSRKKKYIYDSSVMFVGRTYTIKFYKKYDEFFKHDFKLLREENIEKAINLMNSVQNDIRVEIGYKREFLVKYLKLKNKIVKVKDIIKYQDKLLKHFQMVNNKLYANTPVEDLNDISIKKTFINNLGKTKGLQLFFFYKEYFKSKTARDNLKLMMSKPTYYKRKKLMDNLIKKVKLSETLCFGKPYKATEQSVLNNLEQYIQNEV